MLDELTNEERAQRITTLIGLIGKPKNQLAEILNVTPQAITGWQKTGRISREVLNALCVLAGKPVEYLIVKDWLPKSEGTDDWEDIKGFAQAVGLGDGKEATEFEEAHQLKFRADSLRRKRLRAPDLAVVYGAGDSMLPRIRPGDAILFDKSDCRPSDEALFVIRMDGAASWEYSVKRCRYFDDFVFFDSLNPEGDHKWRKPRRMDDRKRPIEIMGRVRWIGSWED